VSGSQVRSFFDTYRETFARYDAAALADLFAFPLQVLSDAEQITPLSIASREDWVGVLEGLLGGYRTLGVAAGEPLEFDATELTPRISSTRVHWELRREDGSAIYQFTAVYTVVASDGQWRVAAIAHDELPKLGAALAAASSA
jgi:hypothetical protein